MEGRVLRSNGLGEVTENGWQFGTVRGENGVTNFVVYAPDNEGKITIPALEDWRWAEWTGMV